MCGLKTGQVPKKCPVTFEPLTSRKIRLEWEISLLVKSEEKISKGLFARLKPINFNNLG
jgi:hypothetical protein